MSASLIANTRFFLDEDEILEAAYDAEADVLYLWREGGPAPGIALTTEDGHIVRFDPDTGEVVGFTLPDWAARWRDKKKIEIRLEVPAHGTSERDEDEAKTHRVLALVG
jgi:hypothetical protein